MMEPLLVGIGGAIGAVGRFAVGRLVRYEAFPVGTLVVNVLGSFVLGLVLFGAPQSDLVLLVGVGCCGAFTTFSSFSFQTVELWEHGNPGLAALNAGGNLVVSLIGFGVGWLVVAG